MPNYKDVQNIQVRASYAMLAGVIAIVCNFLLSAIKFFAGFITGSISITADAVNNMFDAGVGITTAIGFKLARRPADKEHPYGHARYEYLTGLFIAVIIIVVGFELLQTSVQKIMQPTKVSINIVAIIILTVSAIVKLLLMLFYKKLNIKLDSQAIQAAKIDCRNDFLSTCAIIISAIIIKFTNFNIDGYVGVIISGVILYSGIRMIKNAADPLIGTAPSKELISSINDKILSYNNILGVHDLILHDYGPGRRFGSVHVEIDCEMNTLQAHNVVDEIEKACMQQFNIIMVIHQDPISLNDEIKNKYYVIVSEKIKKISQLLEIHDFRAKSENKIVKLSFDVNVPYDFDMSDDEIKAKIKTVQNEYVEVETLTLDRI